MKQQNRSLKAALYELYKVKKNLGRWKNGIKYIKAYMWISIKNNKEDFKIKTADNLWRRRKRDESKAPDEDEANIISNNIIKFKLNTSGTLLRKLTKIQIVGDWF